MTGHRTVRCVHSDEDSDTDQLRLGIAEFPEVEELARRQGVRPIASADELARLDTFESDEELDEFLADLYETRRAVRAMS